MSPMKQVLWSNIFGVFACALTLLLWPSGTGNAVSFNTWLFWCYTVHLQHFPILTYLFVLFILVVLVLLVAIAASDSVPAVAFPAHVSFCFFFTFLLRDFVCFFFQRGIVLVGPKKNLPSRELTYPPKNGILSRWFSDLPKVGYVSSWRVIDIASSILRIKNAPFSELARLHFDQHWRLVTWRIIPELVSS